MAAVVLVNKTNQQSGNPKSRPRPAPLGHLVEGNLYLDLDQIGQVPIEIIIRQRKRTVVYLFIFDCTLNLALLASFCIPHTVSFRTSSALSTGT